METLTNQVIRNRIKILRKQKKLTQQDVSDFLGTTKQAYYKYEKGINKVNIALLEKLTKLYNIDLYTFFRGL